MKRRGKPGTECGRSKISKVINFKRLFDCWCEGCTNKHSEYAVDPFRLVRWISSVFSTEKQDPVHRAHASMRGVSLS